MTSFECLTYRDVCCLPCNRSQVQIFHFLSRPGSSTQKRQAGFDAGILVKTFDGDTLTQLSPAVLLDEMSEYHFKRNSV